MINASSAVYSISFAEHTSVMIRGFLFVFVVLLLVLFIIVYIILFTFDSLC